MSRELVQRITDYLSGGGLVNPELANHKEVRDLLIDCRSELGKPEPAPEPVVSFQDSEEGLWITLEFYGAYFCENLSERKPARYFIDAYRRRK
jgi:hypothetical protein